MPNYTAQLKAEGNLLRRPTPKRKAPRKRIPRMSAKRKRDNALYLKKRADYLKSHPFCEAWGIIWPDRPKALTPRANQIHHVAGRIGKNYLDEGLFLAVCSESHAFIHSHPSTARKMGLLQ